MKTLTISWTNLLREVVVAGVAVAAAEEAALLTESETVREFAKRARMTLKLAARLDNSRKRRLKAPAKKEELRRANAQAKMLEVAREKDDDRESSRKFDLKLKTTATLPLLPVSISCLEEKFAKGIDLTTKGDFGASLAAFRGLI